MVHCGLRCESPEWSETTHLFDSAKLHRDELEGKDSLKVSVVGRDANGLDGRTEGKAAWERRGCAPSVSGRTSARHGRRYQLLYGHQQMQMHAHLYGDSFAILVHESLLVGPTQRQVLFQRAISWNVSYDEDITYRKPLDLPPVTVTALHLDLDVAEPRYDLPASLGVQVVHHVDSGRNQLTLGIEDVASGYAEYFQADYHEVANELSADRRDIRACEEGGASRVDIDEKTGTTTERRLFRNAELGKVTLCRSAESLRL